MSVLIVDIDNMAEINIYMGKSYGSKIVDDCIKVFKNNISSKCILYRYGPDIFILTFPGRDTAYVLDTAKTMQKEIVSLSQMYGTGINYTGGIACMDGKTHKFSDVLVLASECMKKGKQDGKGLIYVHSPHSESGTKKTILVVDDDKIMLSILTTRYTSKGYNVYSTENGEEALKIFKNNNIDLVITDYFMPGMSGYDVIKGIRQLNQKVTILVLSALKAESFADTALKTGANDYRTKPFSPVELDSWIDEFLN